MNSENEPLLRRNTQPHQYETRASQYYKKWIHVIFNLELAMALHSFSHGIHGVIVTNLYIEKACRYRVLCLVLCFAEASYFRVNLNYPKTVCDNINEYDAENNQVQIIVSTLELYSIFLSSIPW